jgi:hypothetical protein
MIEEARVLPECEGDTLWAWFLLHQTPQHVKGCDQVMKRLKASKPSQLRIGIVDDDKRKSRDYAAFGKIIKRSDGLRLIHKENTKHYIIIIEPAIEKWLLNMAHISGTRHNYSLETLKTDMKSEEVHTEDRVKQFMNTINQRNPKGVKEFKLWLNTLLSKGSIN